MPRYVILRHELPEGGPRGSHWDFMLEQNGGLRTWAVDHEPAIDTQQFARELPDHRVDYLTYQGPVARDRGHVTQWDAGTYRVVEETADVWRVELTGRRLNCRATLRRNSDDDQRWIVVFGSSSEPA